MDQKKGNKTVFVYGHLHETSERTDRNMELINNYRKIVELQSQTPIA